MLDGGVAPDATIISELETFLRDRAIRPLTDKVTVAAPADVPYNIKMTYYINRSDAGRAASIQNAVQSAIADYCTWQRKIGRDINPSELIRRVIQGGAKRVELISPSFRKLEQSEIARYYDTNEILYGGLEDD